MSRYRVMVAVCLALPALAAPPDAHAAGGLTESARERLTAAQDGDMLDVIVVMADGTDAALASSQPREVGARLRALANRSQRPLLTELNRHQARGDVAKVVRLPIINGLAITARKRTILEVSTRPDIAYICADSKRHVPRITPADPPERVSTNGFDWHITATRADLAWATFGLRGEGLVIGNIDTGANVAHPALAANYRGGSNSFFDAINGLTYPCDDSGHGTATTGGICGNDPAASFYGVAPNAKFIVARAFGAASGGGDGELLACAGWMLDPDGNEATADMPNVVNNSWGVGQTDPWFQSMIQAWEAAGIYYAFAAGNSGPAPGTITSPADYLNVLAVGATKSTNLVASWSSRGPATWNEVDYLKPNLVAPGSGVRVPRYLGGYYDSVGGTSFACPQVTAAIALLLQKQPLLSHEDVMARLESTAGDLGDPGPDYNYGNGLLDVHAAMAGAPPQLTFTGAAGYESDGVEPNTADATTDVTWKILYSDPEGYPPAGAVRLHISAGGVPLPGSPFDMVHEGVADFTTGEVYSYTARLARGSDYSYHFEASDGNSPAEGEGTAAQLGPTIRNSAPVLSWLGSDGYVTDGVTPDVGGTWSTAFRFGVQYSDADGDPPRTVRVRIERNGSIIRKIRLTTPRKAPDYVRGAGFYVGQKLPPGRYRYLFVAGDGEASATGEPTHWHRGPVLQCPPRLDWTGGLGYETDGVEPDDGEPGSTVFEFRVKVSDTEGQAPEYVKLLLRRNGGPVTELSMFPRPRGSYRAGWVYKRRVKLPRGAYSYRFAAADADGPGVGPATRWQTGLAVQPPASPAPLTVLMTATGVGRAAEVTVTLSSAADLSCRVLNLAGRPVRTVCPKSAGDQGVQRLVWDCRDANGLRVPEGTYLVEVVARDASGRECRALCAVAVRRR